MKVVFATGIFPPDIGGPANSVSMLAEAWSARGHRVVVVTYADLPPGGHDEIAPEARPFEVLRIARTQPIWKRYVAFLRALWRASDQAGPIFAQDAIVSGVPALIVSWLRGRRLILRIAGDFAWEHAQVQHGYRESLETFQKDLRVPPGIFLVRALQRFVYRRAARVIAPSRYLADVLRSWGVMESRIRVIYNGVEALRIEAPQQTHPHRIVVAGRLVPWKNVDILIKAMSRILQRVPDAELQIIGDGPERERLEALASFPHVRGRVHFTGRLKPEEVGQALMSCGVHALVSSYEGFSHQLVAGFLYGAPTVASRAGGNIEIIEDGRNGLLVEVGDVEGTANALIRMLEERPFAERCVSEAKRDLSRFSVETQIAQTSEEILTAPGLRVVLVSRDGSVADSDSRTAARMRMYGERVEYLQIVCLARREAASVELSPRVRVEAIDVRTAWSRPWTLVRAVREAISVARANLVVAQDPFEAGAIALAAVRGTGVPLLTEEHGGVYLSEHWKEESLKNRMSSPVGLGVLRRSEGIRVVSAKIEEDLRKRFPSKLIERIPVFSEPRTCRSSAPPDVFGYVGRFVAQKNLYGLLEAFALVTKRRDTARLVMAGSGPLEADLKTRARELGIADRVDWLPHTEDVDALYGRIGTLVLSSWYEGWARVVPEAMSCGIPVVMTNVGCAGELLRNGVEGYVVPIGDTEILAEAMSAILEPGQHGLMAAAAKRRAETMATPEALAERMVAFWKTVAGV